MNDKKTYIPRRPGAAIAAVIAVVIVALLWPTAPLAQRKKRGSKQQPARVGIEKLFEEAAEAYKGYDPVRLRELVGQIGDRLENESRVTDDMRDRLTLLQNGAVALDNMLSRVEQIVIVDSVSVPVGEDEMLHAIPLSPAVGTLYYDDGMTGFIPAAGREVFYTAIDSLGHSRIMHAGIRDDGTREGAAPLRLFADPDIETAFPFLMADGATLYFAAFSKDERTLGSVDIFMTRRDDSGNFYEPTNIGMPYNSPANDFLYVIDEVTGLGYWLSDRASDENMVTVYTFIPNATRQNYAPDSPDIAGRAAVTSVRATQPDGFDAAATLARADRARRQTADMGDEKPELTISLGDGRIFVESQGVSAGARRLLETYRNQESELADLSDKLAGMRETYAKGGNKVPQSLAGEILDAEQRLTYLQNKHKETANQLVSALR